MVAPVLLALMRKLLLSRCFRKHYVLRKQRWASRRFSTICPGVCLVRFITLIPTHFLRYYLSLRRWAYFMVSGHTLNIDSKSTHSSKYLSSKKPRMRATILLKIFFSHVSFVSYWFSPINPSWCYNSPICLVLSKWWKSFANNFPSILWLVSSLKFSDRHFSLIFTN